MLGYSPAERLERLRHEADIVRLALLENDTPSRAAS